MNIRKNYNGLKINATIRYGKLSNINVIAVAKLTAAEVSNGLTAFLDDLSQGDFNVTIKGPQIWAVKVTHRGIKTTYIISAPTALDAMRIAETKAKTGFKAVFNVSPLEFVDSILVEVDDERIQ